MDVISGSLVLTTLVFCGIEIALVSISFHFTSFSLFFLSQAKNIKHCHGNNSILQEGASILSDYHPILSFLRQLRCLLLIWLWKGGRNKKEWQKRRPMCSLTMRECLILFSVFHNNYEENLMELYSFMLVSKAYW